MALTEGATNHLSMQTAMIAGVPRPSNLGAKGDEMAKTEGVLSEERKQVANSEFQELPCHPTFVSAAAQRLP